MEPERWRRIKEVFTTALEIPPALRQAWLNEALPGDPSLAEEVRSLVAAYEGGGEVFEQGALAAAPELRQELQTAVEGLRIGPYRILSELGRGGMGAVYLAVRDDAAYEQRVAIKLVKRGMDTDEIVRRFVHERKILAGLAHPNIARLLDGGTTADGRPYFVMEYVEGRRITVFAREKKLGVEEKLRLFVKVCSAVQFAHQNLIVHRDLKPGNLLVDRDGEPKLLDFGIAKLLAPPSLGGLSELTRAHQRPMTPEYASPEQIAGGVVTTATDVYGLGILLYELLVGHNPAAVERQLGAGWAERPASQSLRALGDLRTARRLQGDLDTIIGKALDREPQRRYATATALAEDVERHLDRRPVKARRPTVGYRLGRTLVRHKLASAFVLSVAMFAGVAGYQAYAIGRERDRAEEQRFQTEEQRFRAEQERRRTKVVLGLMKGLFRSADPQQNRGRRITVSEILEAGASQLLHPEEHPPRWAPVSARGLAFDPGTRADLLNEIADIEANRGFYAISEKLLAKALELREGLTGRDNELGKAASHTLLGHLAFNQGRFVESRPYYLKAIAIKQKLLGHRGPSLAEDLNGLGSGWNQTGEPETGAEYLREAEVLGRQAGHRGLRQLAVSLNNLASSDEKQQRFAEARQRYQDALDIGLTEFGADDPETLITEVNFGSFLLEQKDYARAESLYQDILQTQERVLGTDHRDLILTLGKLAEAQLNRSHYAQAADSLRRALALRRRLGLTPNVDEATDLINYAESLRLQGDLRGAEESYQKSYQLYLRLAGDHRSDIAIVRERLSHLKPPRR
jgi:eukaryotic-like serine/threonine-protein kinase